MCACASGGKCSAFYGGGRLERSGRREGRNMQSCANASSSFQKEKKQGYKADWDLFHACVVVSALAEALEAERGFVGAFSRSTGP